jgi:hypothetical protein
VGFFTLSECGFSRIGEKLEADGAVTVDILPLIPLTRKLFLREGRFFVRNPFYFIKIHHPDAKTTI